MNLIKGKENFSHAFEQYPHKVNEDTASKANHFRFPTLNEDHSSFTLEGNEGLLPGIEALQILVMLNQETKYKHVDNCSGVCQMFVYQQCMLNNQVAKSLLSNGWRGKNYLKSKIFT
ncbi:hypothetical protein NE237_014271 [Protea cynaroides]|uniref:Uncharacterized protein n=1 Tax=Protea cynaroides TaxID=273540 RepID=A0A9Q0JTG7_9MAGN|nr:hypothetical protein NE237_014271 [Protea cynaroides]